MTGGDDHKTTLQLQQIYAQAMDMIIGTRGTVADDHASACTEDSLTGHPQITTHTVGGRWVPNNSGGPWVPNSYLPYTAPPIQINPLPAGPLSPSAVTNATVFNIPPTHAELQELLGNYRFLIKAIRSLVNAGKLNPEIALQAVDALLMALDDNYDKLDAQATK